MHQQYSIVALTDGEGDVVERYAYGETTILDENGNEIDETEFANPYTYTARRADEELGLLYFRARYYHPQLGQFLSRDPLEYVDGMSQYRAYFVPRGMDPWGLCALPSCKETCNANLNDPALKGPSGFIVGCVRILRETHFGEKRWKTKNFTNTFLGLKRRGRLQK